MLRVGNRCVERKISTWARKLAMGSPFLPRPTVAHREEMCNLSAGSSDITYQIYNKKVCIILLKTDRHK